MTNLAEKFPQFEQGLIEEMEQHGTLKSFQAGDILLKTGQYIRSTMLVLSGKIKIYRENEEGGEFFMYFLDPGQACAVSLTCMLGAETSKIMAKADEYSEVLMIPMEQMEKWMSKYKSWYQFVIQTYRSRFDELLSSIDQIAFQNMDERLEFYLKRLYQNSKSAEVHKSHQEIANDLHSSREVISRLLKKMEQKGMVRLDRNLITILDSSWQSD